MENILHHIYTTQVFLIINLLFDLLQRQLYILGTLDIWCERRRDVIYKCRGDLKTRNATSVSSNCIFVN